MEKSLTTNESHRLSVCCGKIEVCCEAFYDAGLALIEIHRDKLYRGVTETFDEFCELRFGFGHRYARYYMKAAETMKNLSGTCQFLPSNERVCRALNQIPDDAERKRVWKRLSEKAAQQGSVVSSNTVEQAVKRLLNRKPKKKPVVVSETPATAKDATIPNPATAQSPPTSYPETDEQESTPDPDAQPEPETMPEDQMELAAKATHEVLHIVFPKVLGYSLRIDRFLRAVGKDGIDTDLIDDCMKQVHAQLEIAERRCRS